MWINTECLCVVLNVFFKHIIIDMYTYYNLSWVEDEYLNLI